MSAKFSRAIALARRFPHLDLVRERGRLDRSAGDGRERERRRDRLGRHDGWRRHDRDGRRHGFGRRDPGRGRRRRRRRRLATGAAGAATGSAAAARRGQGGGAGAAGSAARDAAAAGGNGGRGGSTGAAGTSAGPAAPRVAAAPTRGPAAARRRDGGSRRAPAAARPAAPADCRPATTRRTRARTARAARAARLQRASDHRELARPVLDDQRHPHQHQGPVAMPARRDQLADPVLGIGAQGRAAEPAVTATFSGGKLTVVVTQGGDVDHVELDDHHAQRGRPVPARHRDEHGDRQPARQHLHQQRRRDHDLHQLAAGAEPFNVHPRRRRLTSRCTPTRTRER